MNTRTIFLSGAFAAFLVASAMDALLSEIAELRARFRSLHLTAHLDQAKVLSEAQIEQYMELRKSGRNQGKGERMRMAH